MVEDVRLAANGQCPVAKYGRLGGVFPLPDEIGPELDKLVAAVAQPEESNHVYA
jgi:hypothetical protein